MVERTCKIATNNSRRVRWWLPQHGYTIRFSYSNA
uniref:Uncharacterized protein n=1 Tax=Arundo donax TaxID=35708 RepID=A0A0A8ZUU7_ARUDO